MKVIWRIGKVAEQWLFAGGVWIPKEEESKNIDQFRSIYLLSAERKLLFSIVTRHLTDYLLRNSYMDTSVQKGGIPKLPGCLEHNGVVTQLIREAREIKVDLVVLWLDLTTHMGPYSQAGEEPGEGIRLQPERHSSHRCDQPEAGVLVNHHG